MIVALTYGDATKMVSSTWSLAGSDERGRFLGRRVVGAAEDAGRSALPEGEGQRFAELLVVRLQPPDAFGRGLQSPQQRGVGGALPVGNRSACRRWVASGAEAFDLGPQVWLVVEPGPGDPGFLGDGVDGDPRSGLVHAAQGRGGAF